MPGGNLEIPLALPGPKERSPISQVFTFILTDSTGWAIRDKNPKEQLRLDPKE